MSGSMFGQLGYEAISTPQAVATRVASSIPLLGSKPTEAGDTASQFTLFQLTGDRERPLKDLTEVEPALAGTGDYIDVRVRPELRAFHLAASSANRLDEKSRATLRFDLGTDSASPNKFAEPLFWSIAAGLDLYQHASGGTNATEPKAMKDDFAHKLRRAVEIAGGLGQLRIEIMQHAEPPWWRRALSFITTNQSVRKLVASVGFPGIALDAVKLIDEMVGRFEDAAAEPILRSRPLTLAFTQASRDDFEGGLDVVKVGRITTGYYVLARHADMDLFRQKPPVFLGATGHLAPRQAWEADKALDPEKTDYRDLTYAVMYFKTEAFNLAGP